jgi:regulator of protease activity HflC (stomatin/prohibitin superfamily)
VKTTWLWIVLGIGFVLFIFFVPMQCRTIGAGERGVVLTWGQVEDKIWEEGLHFKKPISQRVVKINVRVVKAETEIGAASKDLQEVSASIALNYHLNPLRVNKLYQTVGRAYQETIIIPAVQEVTKATTAKYTAEELITKRQEVKDNIKETLSERLRTYEILVDEFAIVNFNFSEQFNSAIEAKQTAAQNAIKASRDLDRIKVEAEQRVAQARAESESTILQAQAAAESLRLQRAVITPELIRLRAIEKWNGQLPTYMGGGAIPFIDLK